MQTDKLILKDNLGNVLKTDRIRWCIISDDGQHVLDDPQRKCIWWTHDKQEARRMRILIKRDFNRVVHVRPIEEALRIIAKNRYGFEIQPPITYKNGVDQLTKRIMELNK